MRRTFIAVLTVAAVFTAGVALGQTGPPYTDIAGHKYEPAIVAGWEAGCWEGFRDGDEFKPNNRVTHGELAQVLANCVLERVPPSTTTTTSTTVPIPTTTTSTTTTTTSTLPPMTTTTTTTTTQPPVTSTTVPTGLWIPGWNGPDVGTLTDHTQLAAYTGPSQFTAAHGTVLIENVRVSDTIVNNGANLVFRNVWFDGGGYWWGIINDAGTVLVEDSLSTPPAGFSSYIWLTGNNATVRRTYIEPGEDAVRVGSNSLFEQVQVPAANSADDYGDAFQATGGSNVVIRWSYLANTLQTSQPGAGNAALIATEDQGQIDNWTIEHSVLEGGAQGSLQVNEKALGCPTDFKLNNVIITNGINTGPCQPFTQWQDVVDGNGTPIPNPN